MRPYKSKFSESTPDIRDLAERYISYVGDIGGGSVASGESFQSWLDTLKNERDFASKHKKEIILEAKNIVNSRYRAQFRDGDNYGG